ncbi:hypothetical protein B0H19DRAFT_1070738 [Mycena capillaripes]|nr:hypothetical protein B0H19DRAFT_1070738 [Mycena capillaripes]
MKFSLSTCAVLLAACDTAVATRHRFPDVRADPHDLIRILRFFSTSDTQPFNITYDSNRFFKEDRLTVVSGVGGTFPGVAILEDLVPTSRSPKDTSAIYSVTVDSLEGLEGNFLFGSQTGARTIYILEKYSSEGGVPAIDVVGVPVVFTFIGKGITSVSTKDLAYSQQHVQERALERYRLELDADDYLILNDAVQRARNEDDSPSTFDTSTSTPEEDGTSPAKGKGAVTLLNDEGDEQIWSVVWATQTLVCVWSISLGRVTTLLPEGTIVTRRKGTKGRKGKGKK